MESLRARHSLESHCFIHYGVAEDSALASLFLFIFFFISLTQARAVWEDRTLIEKIPASDCLCH